MGIAPCFHNEKNCVPPNRQYTAVVCGDRPMQFRPEQDRVLVRRSEQEETTAGGVIIPETVQK